MPAASGQSLQPGHVYVAPATNSSALSELSCGADLNIVAVLLSVDDRKLPLPNLSNFASLLVS